MFIGYARVSTLDQNPQHQIDALNEAGCKKIFTEKISGASKKRKQLEEALDYMREGDTLVVWKLSRLRRCIPYSSHGWRSCIAGTSQRNDADRFCEERYFPGHHNSWCDRSPRLVDMGHDDVDFEERTGETVPPFRFCHSSIPFGRF